MIITKDGKSASLRTDDEELAILQKELSTLDAAEREVLEIMLEEARTGKTQDGLAQTLGKLEYKTTPVDMKTFVMDPYYLGNTCDNLYPKWLEDLTELFEGGYHECLFTGSIGSGKCVSPDTEIYDVGSGRRVRAGDVTEARVVSMSEQGALEVKDAKGFPSGWKACVRLRLLSGQSVILSTDHPVFSSRGWIKADEITRDDFIATPRSMPEPETAAAMADEQVLGHARTIDSARLPAEMYGLPTRQVKLLLVELWANFGIRGCAWARIALPSEEAAKDVAFLLLRVGIRSLRMKDHRLLVKQPGDVARLSQILAGEDPIGVHAQDSLHWEPVDSITPLGVMEVCDLSVKDNHSFVGEGIILHNTFAASIGVCRVLYELSCLKDPHRSFGLAAGSNISIVALSVTETLATKVVFENISMKISASTYFRENFPFEQTKKELRFPNNIWVASRATTDTSALGLNTISAFVDECLAGDSQVLLAGGEQVSALELYQSGKPFSVGTFDFLHNCPVSAEAHIKRSTDQACYELRLANGKVLRASGTHPVAVWEDGVARFETVDALRVMDGDVGVIVIPGGHTLKFSLGERNRGWVCLEASCPRRYPTASMVAPACYTCGKHMVPVEAPRRTNWTRETALYGMRLTDNPELAVTRVVEKKYLGVIPTYDISVPGYEVFIADGVLVHNTNFMPTTKTGASADPRLASEDRAETIYNAIKRRMKSRFERAGRLPGMLFLVSSKTTQDSFTNKRLVEARYDPLVFVRDYAIWDVKPEAYFADKRFSILAGNDQTPSKFLSDAEATALRANLPEGCVIVDVPENFRLDFEKDLEKSLRDLAGIATLAVSPFIQRREKIKECIDKSRTHPFSSTVYDSSQGGGMRWEELVKVQKIRMYGERTERPMPILNPRTPRVIHVDPSYRRDSLGFAMGHVGGYKDVARRDQDGRQFTERAPLIVMDFMLRWVPPTGGEIVFGDVRRMIYDLSARGFQIQSVTMDTFQSVDMIQQLNSKGYTAKHVSVDTSPDPYDALKSAIYENRISYYEYMPLLEELQTIEQKYDSRKRRKIDHPPRRSKDVSDAVAGVVWELTQSAPISTPLGMSQGNADGGDLWMEEARQAYGGGDSRAGQNTVYDKDMLFPFLPAVGNDEDPFGGSGGGWSMG